MKSRARKNKPAHVPNAEHPGELPAEASADTRSTLDKARDKDAAELFAKMRRELGSDAKVSLHRSHPPTGQFKSSFIGTLPIDQFSIEQVTQIYGGGDFTAVGKTGSGTFAQEQRFSFSIDHTIMPKNPMAVRPEEKPRDQMDVAALLREARESAKPDNSLVPVLLQQMTAMTTAALQRPEPKGETAALVEIIKEIREESRRSERRMVEMIEAVKASNTPRSLRDQLEEAKELIDLIGGTGGGERPEKESIWKDILKSAAEVFGPMVKQHFAGGGGPPIPGALALPDAPQALTSPPASSASAAGAAEINVTPPAAAQPAAAATSSPQSPDMNPIFQMALRQFRSSAIAAAAKGRDAFDFLDTTWEMIPANYHELIFRTANQPDWFSRIFGADPEALKHVQFMGEIRDSILIKAMVSYATRSAPSGATAASTAKAFLAWVSREFDDSAFSLADDPESWAEAFAGLPIDPVWLEALRAAILSEFAEEPETAGNVVAMGHAETGAAPAAAGESAAAASAPARAAAPAPRKRGATKA